VLKSHINTKVELDLATNELLTTIATAHTTATRKRDSRSISLKGPMLSTPELKSHNFAIHFDNIFGTPPEPSPEPPAEQPSATTQSEITLEMETALSTCKPSGAAGVDKITNNMLKLCPLNIKTRINTVFNASLKLGHLPGQWKKANIKIIRKNKKPKD